MSSTQIRDAIQSFMSITGASHSVALRKLEEYGGNLNAAVHAHFLELERSITNPASLVSSPNNSEVNNHNGVGARGLTPLISAVRSFRPSLLLDPNYRRSLVNGIGGSSFSRHTTYPPPHMGEVTGFPVGLNNRNENPWHSGVRSASLDSTGPPTSYRGEVYGNDLRDDPEDISNTDSEMLQTVIETSKQEFEQNHMNELHSSSYGSSSVGPQQRQQEDDELARAISLSLKDHYEQLGIYDSNARAHTTTVDSFKAGGSSLKEQPLNKKSSLQTPKHLQHSKDSLNPYEWGGISSKELDEAILLETQLFSQIPERASSRSSHLSLEQSGPRRINDPGQRTVSHPHSASLREDRLLRQQQDDEYLASLLADEEKEMNSLKKAESSKEEESCRKKLAGKEAEQVISGKETSLPPEPAIDDENAVAILIRLPDGSRHGRRFLKSDKLQLLFDFIETGKVAKPGTYRVVQPYPRRVLGAGVGDRSLSLDQIGLTGKQEALFLEFV